MRKWFYILPAFLFASLLLLFWESLDPERDPHALPSVMIGKTVPDVSLPSLLDDSIFTPKDFQGKIYLINFFASWCVPCRGEHELLKRLTQATGVPIIGIAYKNKKEDALAFLEEEGSPYQRVVSDESGRAAIEFGLYGVPETYLIDASGKILFRQAGPLDPDTIQSQLLPLLDKAP